MNPTLLSLLVCPVTKQRLRLADETFLRTLPAGLDAALVREDGEWIYPVRDGIPILLEGEAIQIAKTIAT